MAAAAAAAAGTMPTGPVRPAPVPVALDVVRFDAYRDLAGEEHLAPDLVTGVPPWRVGYRVDAVKGDDDGTLELADAAEGGNQHYKGERDVSDSHYIVVVREVGADGAAALTAYPVDRVYTLKRAPRNMHVATVEEQLEVFDRLAKVGERRTAADLARQKLAAARSGDGDGEAALTSVAADGTMRTEKIRSSTLVEPLRHDDVEAGAVDESGAVLLGGRRGGGGGGGGGGSDSAAAGVVFENVGNLADGADDLYARLDGGGGGDDDDGGGGGGGGGGAAGGAGDGGDAEGRQFDVFGGANDEVAPDYQGGAEVGDDAGDAGEVADGENAHLWMGVTAEDEATGEAALADAEAEEVEDMADLEPDELVARLEADHDRADDIAKAAAAEARAAAGPDLAAKRGRPKSTARVEADAAAAAAAEAAAAAAGDIFKDTEPAAKRPRTRAEYDDVETAVRERVRSLLVTNGGRINQRILEREFGDDVRRRGEAFKHLVVKVVNSMTKRRTNVDGKVEWINHTIR